MTYALNLADDGRILSAAVMLPKGKYDGQPIVDTLPDGNLYEYRYADGKFIYDPLPVSEEEHQPTQEERIAALEARFSAYEAAYAEGVNEA